MAKSTVWLSYDLGVKGDYEGLFTWLDGLDARECGDTLAVFSYEYDQNLPELLRAELSEAIQHNKRTRIYIVYRDRKTDKNKGAFLFGTRRAAPWTGFAGESEVDDEEDV